MKIKKFSNLLLAAASILIALLFAELAIRYLGKTDQDGNLSIRWRTLRPYQLPISQTEELINAYLSLGEKSRFAYDANLGWTSRPNWQSRDRLYRYNGQTIRSASSGSPEYPLSPEAGVLRIAIFGDSFTHGDDVPYDHTWGYFLEEKLKQAGIKAEVLNFGVGGYGMGQAYLRWQMQGRQFAPNLVIFGLQMENVKRNVNILRSLYYPKSDLPLSKPRFVLEDSVLALLNVPTIPPEKLPQVMRDIGSWPLAEHEHFINPDNYDKHFWLKSKLVSLFLTIVLNRRETDPHGHFSYDLSSESAQLTLAIVRAFGRDVQSSGAEFLGVYLPTIDDLGILWQAKPLPYADLLGAIGEECEVIRPEKELLRKVGAYTLPALFVHNHYSPVSNEVIGEALADRIVSSRPRALGSESQ